MASFTYESASVAVRPDIADSHREAWAALAEPGTWWAAAERLAIAERARTGFAQRAKPPWLRQLPPPGPELSARVAEVVDKIALDAGNVDREWAAKAIADIGDGQYVELVATVATVVMIDVFAEAVGVERAPLPGPRPGEPTRIRPDGLGDIGSYVPALDPFPGANVARALSLVPEANKLFRCVSVPTYSAPGFASLQWDTPLTRPQVELVATRVAAMNECFY
jgi:hypothetical protein